MKILNSRQLKEADERTLALRAISSWQLMERASAALFEALKADLDIYRTPFTVLCGPGNNGGDGLALARMLFSAGGSVRVFLLESPSYSADNQENQERLGEVPLTYFDQSSRLEFHEKTVIIDALYGYGLNRPLAADWSLVAEQINTSGLQVLAVDMPSGLLADAPTPVTAPVIRAHRVYTFHCPKKALLLPENAERAGAFTVVDIGLEEDSRSQEEYITTATVKAWLKTPSRFSHKGTFGHALIAGGSYGKTGAVQLACRAALKTGCGLVTAWVPRCAYLPLQTAVPEAMVMTATEEEYLGEFPEDPGHFSAMGIGTGMGTSAETEAAFLHFLQKEYLPPLVLDADALNCLARHPDRLTGLPENTVLTPHPKELERIIGPWKNDFEKLETVRHFCRERRVILVIKGANTAVVYPDGSACYNSTGNYGMAKGGSGDVLTGMITSLLAQGYTLRQAVVLGVFLHGLAGDLARDIHGPRGMTATDIVRSIPAAWREISR